LSVCDLSTGTVLAGHTKNVQELPPIALEAPTDGIAFRFEPIDMNPKIAYDKSDLVES